VITYVKGLGMDPLHVFVQIHLCIKLSVTLAADVPASNHEDRTQKSGIISVLSIPCQDTTHGRCDISVQIPFREKIDAVAFTSDFSAFYFSISFTTSYFYSFKIF